jgi:hypothetical protein
MTRVFLSQSLLRLGVPPDALSAWDGIHRSEAVTAPQPYDPGWKSASNIGSRMSLSAP